MNELCNPLRPQSARGCKRKNELSGGKGRERMVCGTQKNTATKRGRFVELSSIVLYPNPTSGLVHIRLAEQNSGSDTIALFDLAGRVVAEHQILFSNGHGSINFENLSPGIYTCKLGNGNSAFYAKLIIAAP